MRVGHNQKDKKKERELLPVSVIKAASKLDAGAICQVVKYYDGYMRKLATLCMYDEDGNVQFYVDEDIYSRLKMKLIETTIKFKI